MSYNEAIFNQICSHLEENGYHFFSVPEKGVVCFSVSASRFVHIHHVQYGINVKDDSFVVNCNAPFRFNPEDKAETRRVSEFIVRANYGLKAGCFEMDYSDGEVRFRIWVPAAGFLENATIERAIDIACAMFARYGEGIADVIFKGVSPKDAVERCENPAAAASGDDSDGEGGTALPADLRAQLEQLFRSAGGSSDADDDDDDDDEDKSDD